MHHSKFYWLLRMRAESLLILAYRFRSRGKAASMPNDRQTIVAVNDLIDRHIGCCNTLYRAGNTDRTKPFSNQIQR